MNFWLFSIQQKMLWNDDFVWISKTSSFQWNKCRCKILGNIQNSSGCDFDTNQTMVRLSSESGHFCNGKKENAFLINLTIWPALYLCLIENCHPHIFSTEFTFMSKMICELKLCNQTSLTDNQPAGTNVSCTVSYCRFVMCVFIE